MNSILPFVLRAMSIAAPDRDHTELGTAIANVVDAQPPLFPGDTDKTRTASFLVAVADRESTLNNGAIGDHGLSHCAFQIHLPGGGRTTEGWYGEDLRSDVNRCVTVGYRMLLQSIRVDADFPVAFYARGPRWRTDEARRISRDRTALAKRIRLETIAAIAKESAS